MPPHVYNPDQKWQYNDPNGTFVMTEAQIIEEYFDYWAGNMIKRGLGKHVSKDACVDDWIVIHWAWKVE